MPTRSGQSAMRQTGYDGVVFETLIQSGATASFHLRPTEPSMRSINALIYAAALVATLWVSPIRAQDAVFANGFEPRQFCDLGAGPGVCPGFRVDAPGTAVPPGQSLIKSLYFRAGNSVPLAVRRIAATRDPGVSALTIFATYGVGAVPQECRPEGTFETGACCSSGSLVAAPLLFAQQPTNDLQFSARDGGGNPLALELQPDQPLCLQLQFSNPTAAAVTATASVQMEAQLPGAPYTATAPLLALTSQILIPPNATGAASHNCPTRANTSFWMLTTRTFRRSTLAQLRTGMMVLLQSTDWERPNVLQLAQPPFLSFTAANPLRTECSYNNPGNFTVQFGQSPETDETCEAIGYFFPGTTPAVCFNGVLAF